MNGLGNNTEEFTLHTSPQSCEPHVVGTTAELYAGLLAQTQFRESATLSLPAHDTPSPIQPFNTTSLQESSNFFKSLEWSADGTSLLTSSADHTLRSFILPPTLLDPPHPHILKPYSKHALPEPAYATALYSSYNLANPSTCLLLASLRNLPIRLYSILGGDVLGCYPLVSPTTEAYIAPHSLLFSSSRSHEFFAGSDSMIAVFDINRPGEAPVDVMRTGRRRRSRAVTAAMTGEIGGGLRGIVSAMAIHRDGILAAGTFGRDVGLYDNHGYGETNAVFSIGDGDAIEDKRGNGITQVIWDESGHYLCAVERGSDGISIWDIRGTGERLAWLKGRKAITQQRMGVEIMSGEVWAGGTDGVVRVWEGLGMKEGVVERDWEFEAHGDVVSGIGLHPSGSVLATCSGQRHYPMAEKWEADEDDDSGSEPSVSHVSLSSNPSVGAEPQASQTTFDNSLKVWAL